VAPKGRTDRLMRFLALLEYAPRDEPPPLGRLPSGEAVLVAHPSRAGGFEGGVVPIVVDDTEKPS